jgi:hypothetical protein
VFSLPFVGRPTTRWHPDSDQRHLDCRRRRSSWERALKQCRSFLLGRLTANGDSPWRQGLSPSGGTGLGEIPGHRPGPQYGHTDRGQSLRIRFRGTLQRATITVFPDVCVGADSLFAILNGAQDTTRRQCNFNPPDRASPPPDGGWLQVGPYRRRRPAHSAGQNAQRRELPEIDVINMMS